MNDITVNNVNDCSDDKGHSVSLDERIKKATLDDYHIVLDEIRGIASPLKQEIYGGDLAKVLKVKNSTIMKELQKEVSDDGVELKAVFPELVDLVEDDAGKVGYLIKKDGSISFAESWEGPNGSTYMPPQKEHLPFALGKYNHVKDSYERNDSTGQLFDDLINYFKRFSYLPEDVWPLVAFSTFLSYMQDHKDVRYIPTLYFHAVAERGKSRTAKSFLSVAYRGIHLVDLKTANIFRYSQNLNATLFFDCTDLWGTAGRSDCEDVLLARFEKGTMVSRVQYPDRGAFLDQVRYDMFGSTVVATNEPANSTFESRCLTITMPNMPGQYENLTQGMGDGLKERLIAWRAHMMDKELSDIDLVAGISGRLWDITKPLFQLCELIKPSVREPMRQMLLEMVGQKAEDKKESIEGRIVAAIDQIADFDEEHEEVIPVSDILSVLNLGKSDRYQMSPQKLGKRIKSLSLRTNHVRGYSNLYVTENELNLLKEQYGLSTSDDDGCVDYESSESDYSVDNVDVKRVVESEESAEGVSDNNGDEHIIKYFGDQHHIVWGTSSGSDKCNAPTIQWG